MVEQNANMTADMRALANQNAEQAQSMAILAYGAKRDSEVMKAITVVTLIFLPATFVSVCPILCLDLTTCLYFLFQTIFSMGFFNFNQDQLELSRQGWIYLVCTFPLTFVVLGVSFGWIWWTGNKEEKPVEYKVPTVRSLTGRRRARSPGVFPPSRRALHEVMEGRTKVRWRFGSWVRGKGKGKGKGKGQAEKHSTGSGTTVDSV